MQAIDLHKFKVTCENCNLAELCLPRGLNKDELDELDKVVRQSRPLHKGDHLFRNGDPLSSLYTVRSGSVKLFTHSDNGDEQIVGFYLPGELVGLDGIENNLHSCNAIALETSSLCNFPYTQLTDVCSKVPALQEQMFRLMGREISYENKLLLSLSKKSAEERIATFLRSLSLRFKQLGFSPDEFRLSMSRQDIGNYLGLTIETVSRIFSRLQKNKYILIDKKHIQILDQDGLNKMCTANASESAGNNFNTSS
ncbi:MAG: CRP/FNR family transcriptional regulator [Planctomycetota bacterium]|jgi:CRP/FNR family transcriptional regulator